MKALLGSILLLILLIFGFGYWRTYQMQHGAFEDEFLKGSLPVLDLEGFYKGTANFPTGPWLGKTFSKDSQTGVNIISTIAGQTERFHFKTSTGPGLQDNSIQVIKIDYNLPGNSVLIKPILDEVVETTPGKYLGKVHVRLPYLPPLTVAYFRLEK